MVTETILLWSTMWKIVSPKLQRVVLSRGGDINDSKEADNSVALCGKLRFGIEKRWLKIVSSSWTLLAV